ncbi:MAG: MFS transporter [Vicinamibacterales bacterium]
MVAVIESRRERLAVGSLSLALLMTTLDASLTNTSLPALARAFGGSLADARWIVLACLLAVTSLTVVAGRLGDVLGRRRVFLAAIALFTVASAIDAVVPSLRWLLVARAVQGAGAAAMMALAFAMVGDLPRVRPERVMSRLAAMSAVGTTLGPAMGGVVGHVGPGAIFLVNVPLGIAAFALAWRHLPRDRRRAARARVLRLPGTLLLGSSLLAYVFAMTGGAAAWAPSTITLLTGAAAGAAAFVFVESRTRTPLVPVTMFRRPLLSVSLATSSLVATVVTATLIVGPFYLARGLGLGPTRTGLVLSMGPAAAAVTASVAGQWLERVGATRAVVAGLVMMAAGGALLALLPSATGVTGYAVPLVVMTSGYAVFQTANNTAVLADAGGDRGVVAGLLTLSRNVGQITGASAMASVFLRGTGAEGLASAGREAIAAGMRGTFAVATVLVVTALVLTRLARPRPCPGAGPAGRRAAVQPDGAPARIA